jgi:hypothetical protein
MKSNKSYIIQVSRNGTITYFSYRVTKGNGVTMTWRSRYESSIDDATTFNNYGKALAMLIELDNNKQNTDIKANETYDIIEMENGNK